MKSNIQCPTEHYFKLSTQILLTIKTLSSLAKSAISFFFFFYVKSLYVSHREHRITSTQGRYASLKQTCTWSRTLHDPYDKAGTNFYQAIYQPATVDNNNNKEPTIVRELPGLGNLKSFKFREVRLPFHREEKIRYNLMLQSTKYLV